MVPVAQARGCSRSRTGVATVARIPTMPCSRSVNSERTDFWPLLDLCPYDSVADRDSKARPWVSGR